MKTWPPGTVAVSSWLQDKGVYRQLREVYQKSSWIEPIGHGAFIRAGDQVDWTGGLYALQEQLKLSVHVGGRSALQFHGSAHFLPLGQGQPVFLFGCHRFLPSWFKQYAWGMPVQYFYTNSFPYDQCVDLTIKERGSFSIKISARELAIFEVLYLIGKKETYEHAFYLMEGLTTLRPKMVQELLEKTTSVKVKRLFMHLAEQCNHSWVPYVNLKKVDFGQGKRVITGGGVFDNKYQISVPKRSSQG